ncbi:hypothetical protein D3C71_174370 [compost metagenome]
MHADVPHELEEPDGAEPFLVVDDGQLVGMVAEDGLDVPPDARDVAFDLPLREHRPRRIAEARIAEHGRASAHERNDPVPACSKVAHRDQRHEVSYVQAVRGGVEPDVCGDRPGRQYFIECCKIGALAHEPSLLHELEEGRAELQVCGEFFGHVLFPFVPERTHHGWETKKSPTRGDIDFIASKIDGYRYESGP